MEARLYLLQRVTALIMAPLVIGHIGLILYAMHDGLTAAEILGRTQGSAFWAAYYGLFVIAAAIHAPIGLRNVLAEWTRWQGRSLDIVMALFMLTLFGLGFRAVAAVVS